MYGGEIFIPKIPSSTIMGIVQAIAPNYKVEIIGIRPGEKLHEVMCATNDARLILEFVDHYVIKPSISFNFHANYEKNALKEAGTSVPIDFEYSSETNPYFLGVEEIREMVR